MVQNKTDDPDPDLFFLVLTQFVMLLQEWVVHSLAAFAGYI